MLKRVEPAPRTIVERVVVGEGHGVDADSARSSAATAGARKKNGLPGSANVAAIGDTALEIENEEVGLRDNVADLARHRWPRRANDRAPDLATEHGVTRQREPHSGPADSVPRDDRDANPVGEFDDGLDQRVAVEQRAIVVVRPSISTRRAGPAAAAATERL